jgi:hypothetical protein
MDSSQMIIALSSAAEPKERILWYVGQEEVYTLISAYVTREYRISTY